MQVQGVVSMPANLSVYFSCEFLVPELKLFRIFFIDAVFRTYLHLSYLLISLQVQMQHANVAALKGDGELPSSLLTP